MKQWQNYRQAIVEDYNQRKERRPSYSLRAYARDLGMVPSHLSDVLSKRRGLSTKLAATIAESFDLKAADRQFFIDLVEMEDARSANDRKLAASRVSKRKAKLSVQISDDEVSFLSAWFIPATLELVTVLRGKISVNDIAERLRISVADATESLAVLRRLKLLTPLGELHVRTRDYSHMISERANATLRGFHRQVLKIIDQRIENSPAPDRQNLTTVISFDSSRLSEAREFLEKSQREFMAEFGSVSNANSVFIHAQHFVRADIQEVK